MKIVQSNTLENNEMETGASINNRFSSNKQLKIS